MNQTVEDALVVRMEATLRKFERQMEAGRKVAANTSTDIEKRFANTNRKIQTSSNEAATGIMRMTQMSGRGRFVLQNTANQIGDIAVQMGSGTAASRALGQQLPQLFGGFGALGGALGVLGPLLGTVAALGIPLAVAFFNAGEGAESLEDQVKNLKKALSDLTSAQTLSSQSAGDLLSKYGGLADDARTLFEINRQIASIRAQSSLDSVSRGIAGELGIKSVFGFGPEELRNLEEAIRTTRAEINQVVAHGVEGGSEVDASRRERALRDELAGLREVKASVKDLADLFGITRDEAQEIVAQFAQLGQARGPREQADAMIALSDYINGVTNNLVDAEEEGKALYDRLLEAAQQALKLAGIDMTSPISDAANEAARLAENLANARAERLDALVGGNKDFFDPRNESGEAGRVPVDRPVPSKNKPGYKPPKTRASRGGGGMDKGLAEATRLFQQTRTEAEKYAAELERINELHRLFPEIITNDVKDRAIKALNESATSLGNITDRLESGFEDAFASFVTGAGNARDAARALLSDLARMAAQSAFRSLGVGKLFDGLFGGIPGFAGGTDSAPGGLAIVGERGPELLNVPRGSQIIPNHKIGQAAAGMSVLRVELGPDLEASWLQKSGNQSVQITKAGMDAQTRQARSINQNDYQRY